MIVKIMDETSTPQLLTPDDLQRALSQQAITAHLIRDIGHTPTVPAAAEVLGVATEQIVKTLLFVLDVGAKADTSTNPATNPATNPPSNTLPSAVVVIGNGENRISKKALGQHFGLTPKRVKLATAETVVALLGYAPGGVPPFGHRTQLPILVDQNVVDLRERYADRIFGGGGDDHTMLELTVTDLLRIHQPTILPLSESN